ncbi:Uncharacterised protein [Chlamydia trachomatis]|nr:Uncharacterised protein [Chlamydia trachomatis]
MSIPVRVDPTFALEHTISVSLKAFGSDSISMRSAVVMDFAGSAEYPPIKSTPTFLAALSSACAICTKSSGLLHAEAPTRLIGVTVMRLFTIGIP